MVRTGGGTYILHLAGVCILHVMLLYSSPIIVQTQKHKPLAGEETQLIGSISQRTLAVKVGDLYVTVAGTSVQRSVQGSHCKS